ncbi:lytic transglycosylase domain-containing protein [Actinotalea fermentans]|uniref:Transglycosylase SLT domain-containing protein n=1 Tax=Actinotalea fermentans TaxID=43671 RepID=A0A511YUX3_9CELL|nr:lytic transglycosylase domain-containing protein [Actinotalea fermentans]KGM17906.1 hypothetical protein N867_00200 [Actinotalea fermentans ATCC 43279 = JCM 9966 = DSM 3133]GEN78997.1 hypothetical protein AFE02nite_07310 [Actinotalea fermentans]
MIKKLLLLGGAGCAVVPAVAVLAAIGIGAGASACIETSAGGVLAAEAPVPLEARAWIREAKAACPDLPEAWIAAVMAQESGFRPDAYADDSNGGTWGLFQINEAIWTGVYGHGFDADRDANGVRDIADPLTHARYGGQYLCNRLAGVRQIRADHPGWASSQLPLLDALIIAHNAGESRLRTYPDIPTVTARFIDNVDRRVSEWTTVTDAGIRSDLPDDAATGPTSAPTPEPSGPLDTSGVGCLPGLGTGDVVVPPGTPHDVATAVRTAMSYVGVTSGWHQLCDRLACRAYGYVGSGYPTAAEHWRQMVATGNAHPGDACPPLGSFVFWRTGRPAGHVSVVVQADPGCDPKKVMVTSNGVFDSATGNHGGVYLLSSAQLNAGYVSGTGYLGWSNPVCKGARLPDGTVHPAPSGH